MSNEITVCGEKILRVEYKGQLVLTFKMIDGLHKKPEGSAKDRFHSNRQRFREGEDFYLIDFTQRYVLQQFGIEVPPRGLTLVTESGYLMLVKIFNDAQAWNVQRQLVNGYFQARREAALSPEEQGRAIAGMSKSEILKIALGEAERAEGLEAENAVMAPKAKFFDEVAATEGMQTIQSVAKAFGWGPNRFFAELRMRGILMRDNVPYQIHLNLGRFQVKETKYSVGDVERLTTRTYITPKGITWLHGELASAQGQLPLN